MNYINLVENKRFFILPIIIIMAISFSSLLFFNQIDKLKKQIDTIYFGNFVKVDKLHRIKNNYDKILLSKSILSKEKKIVIKNWEYYFNSYQSEDIKQELQKLDHQIGISLMTYNSQLLKNVIKNLENIIEYETKSAYDRRKLFLDDYMKTEQYLHYNLIAIILITLLIIGYIIYLSLQKHTELEKLTYKYKIDSITDGLTNLYNRKHFDMVFSKVPIISKENGWVSAFVMLDIDFFKQYNDNYGHDMGDMVIKNVANTLRASFNKQYEYVFRLGGEEFGIIMFDTNENRLKKSLDNFQKNILKLEIPHIASATGYLTVSMGALFIDENMIEKEIKELYKEADDKLYKSKESGRNQYTI